jgi:hypothetical protein
MSHHVACTLPDGHAVIVDYRQPIVRVIRRITARTAIRQPGAPDDYATLSRWLDANPGLTCTWEQVRDDTCTHQPAAKDG